MSYFIYLKLKPGSSDLGKLEKHYRERDDQSYPKMLAENLYFLGDGHSSHSLITHSDLVAKAVRLAPKAVKIIQEFSREGKFPSFVVSYETGPPTVDIDSKIRIGINVFDLSSEFWFLEDRRYFFRRET